MSQWNNPPVVVNALIECIGKGVILGTRAHEDGKGKLELIGGFVEVGETLEDALVREIREEVGSDATVPRNMLTYYGSWVGTYSDGRKLLSVVFICSLMGTLTPSAEVSSFHVVKECPHRESLFADCDYAVLKHYFTNYTTGLDCAG